MRLAGSVVFAFDVFEANPAAIAKAVPPGKAEMDAAYSAFVAFGKGSGHPANLNFGDVFSYALAKARGLSLLYKGNDFAQTDVRSACEF